MPYKIPDDLIPKPKQVWISKSKSGLEVFQLQKKALAKLVVPNCPSDAPFGIGLNTFKTLSEIASSRKFPILIPETLVYGYGFENPTLLYTDIKQGLQVIPKLSAQSFEIFLKILSSQRALTNSVIGPLALGKCPNSQFNKLYMRENELKQEFKCIHKTDVVIQRYIVAKGNMCSKYRVVLYEDDIKVFKISNKMRFDRSEYEKKQDCDSKPGTESSFIKSPAIITRNEKKSYQGTSLKAELVRKLTSKTEYFTKFSMTSQKEKKYETLEEFMNSIPLIQPKYNIGNLYAQLSKPRPKTIDTFENLSEDIVNGKISNKLRSMFCTDTKNIEVTNIIELKSQKILNSLGPLCKFIKETLDLFFLIKNNLKISEMICDFAEDTNKKIYFLQVKHTKCKSINYVPLKNIKLSNKFVCPGEHCYDKPPSLQTELFAQSILLPTKKVAPNKCKILLGTILGEKLDPIKNYKHINPRLFERVRVCENCFHFYNDKNERKAFENKSVGKLQYNFSDIPENEEEEILPMEENVRRFTLRREKSYMGMLGAKLYKFQKEMLSKIKASPPKPAIKKEFTVFDCKKRTIDKAIHYDDFIKSTFVV